MSGGRDAVTDFHARVKEACWDSLAGELLNLHEPHARSDGPVCQGCDQGRYRSAPAWPCSTYAIIATAMLSTPSVQATFCLFLASSIERTERS